MLKSQNVTAHHPVKKMTKPTPPPKGRKAQMMRGGMANGKVHMYSGGGSVKDNAGLRALRASGPKGRAAYNKIVNS